MASELIIVRGSFPGGVGAWDNAAREIFLEIQNLN